MKQVVRLNQGPLCEADWFFVVTTPHAGNMSPSYSGHLLHSRYAGSRVTALNSSLDRQSASDNNALNMPLLSKILC